MSKRIIILIIIILTVSAGVLVGCSSNIHLRKDLTSKRAIILLHTGTPSISYFVPDVASNATGSPFDIFLLPLVLEGNKDRKVKNAALNAARGGMKLPNVGKLAVQRFFEKVTEDGDGWPKMEMFNFRVRIDPKALENTTSHEVRLDLSVLRNEIEFGHGYRVAVVASMYDDQDPKAIFKKTIKYESVKYSRDRTFEEYIAEDGKLLKEEIRYAADKVADKLFKALQSDFDRRTLK